MIISLASCPHPKLITGQRGNVIRLTFSPQKISKGPHAATRCQRLCTRRMTQSLLAFLGFGHGQNASQSQHVAFSGTAGEVMCYDKAVTQVRVFWITNTASGVARFQAFGSTGLRGSVLAGNVGRQKLLSLLARYGLQGSSCVGILWPNIRLQ